jgi:glutathione S-transferase
MQLYCAPRTRAFRARWLLEELGAPYETQMLDFSKGEQRAAEYRRIHPLGAVPALVDGETIVIESAAICLYLADRFPEHGLAPAHDHPLRGAYYQWSVFAVATLDPIVAPAFTRSFRFTPDRRHETATDDEHERFARTASALRVPLRTAPFLLGDSFSTADVLVGAVLSWAKVSGLLRSASEIEPYLRRLEDRPAFQRAIMD